MCRAIFAIIFSILSFGALNTHGDISGTWKGVSEAPTGLGALELTFSHPGNEWKAVCKFPEVDGANTFPARDVNVSDTDVSFVLIIESESRQMRFTGKPSGDKIEGNYEMFRAGKSAYSGAWSVKRSRQPASGASVTPRNIQPENTTGIQPPSDQIDKKSVVELPSPTGLFTVGRTTFYWKDSARPETLSDNPNDKRELMVTLWYPAEKEAGLSPAVYFPHYELIGGQSSTPLPSSLKAHAFEQAPVARARQTLPVILFSHGLGENTARYSAMLEELASHGYVVAAIDHTYENQGVVFPDGRIVRWSNRWEWAFDRDSIDQERFIRAQLAVMVDDVSFVLDQLKELNEEPIGVFKRRLDLSNIGFFGHSLGGAIAPRVCQKDRRFKGCLNQDGMFLGEALMLDAAGDKLARPFMFVGHCDAVTDDTLDLMALSRKEYEGHDLARRRRAFRILDTMPLESYVVSISGAEHSSFTDNPLLEAHTLSTYRSRERTLGVIRDYTREFFDKYLMGKPSTLLDKKSCKYPQAIVDRFGARVRK